MTMPKDPQKEKEYRKLLSDKAKGRVFSDEHRRKLSEAKIKNPVKYWQGKNRKDYDRQHYLENKEKRYASNAKWRSENKDLVKSYSKEWLVRRNEKLEKVAGRPKPEICEICGKGGRICFDHCHKTGKFRGWICESCNVLLGFAKDDISTLQSLVKYLKKFSTLND